jgi:H+/gluconate symporter-like permease
LPLFAFSIGNLIVYGPKKSLPYFILFIYFGAQKFIFPLISQKDKDSYVAKIEADEDAEWKNREDKEAFSVYLMRILGHKNIILVINLMLAVQLVHLSGELYASKRTKYLVPTNDMSKVVLNIYGDSIVYASFDKNTKKVKPVFSVSKLASDPNLVFNLEEIGPLTPSSQK